MYNELVVYLRGGDWKIRVWNKTSFERSDAAKKEDEAR
jgi:hypothetical protein